MSLQHIQKNSPGLLPKPAKFEKNLPNGYRVIRKTKCGAGGAAGAGGAGSSPIHKQASLAGRLTTNLCLTNPRCKCYEHRCIEHLLGGSGRLCLLFCSTHTKSHTENEHLQVQDDSSTRVAQNALVLGSSESVNQAPLQLPQWPHLLKQLFSQKFHQNLMYLNLHVWHLDTTQNHLNHSLSRWQIELRHLKDPHLEDSMSQGGPFWNSGANSTRWSAQSLLPQT